MPDILPPAWVQDWVHTYGLWIIFVLVMLESMGVPLPGETALVTAALYAGTTQQLSILAVIAAAATGAVTGDNIGYLIGRFIGLRLLRRYGGRIGLGPDRLRLGQYLFLRHGGKIVFFGRFVAFLRAFAAILAGANRMSWPRFLAMNALGGAGWAILFGGGAYFLGEEIKRVAGPLSLLFLIAAVGLIAAGTIFFRRHERELTRRARDLLPEP